MAVFRICDAHSEHRSAFNFARRSRSGPEGRSFVNHENKNIISKDAAFYNRESRRDANGLGRVSGDGGDIKATPSSSAQRTDGNRT